MVRPVALRRARPPEDRLAAGAAALVGVGAAAAWKLRADIVRRLAPRPGERLLGAGRHAGALAADVAERLWPGGELALVDVADSAADEARERGLESVSLVGDAERLPFEDASFDGAYVTGPTDFAELRRVLPRRPRRRRRPLLRPPPRPPASSVSAAAVFAPDDRCARL